MNLIPFQFDALEIRVVEIDGEPWFVAIDVARALGYLDPTNAIKQHTKGVVKHHPLSTPGGIQHLRVVSEGDVMRLIVRCGLSSAERFERWVFEDVLPQIRKTGRYGAPDPMAVLNDPAAMRGLLLGYTEKVLALESQVAEQAPKVAALDRISDAGGALCLSNAAKALQIQPRAFTRWLCDRMWIFQRHARWAAYQPHIDRGHLVHKVYVRKAADDEPELAFEQVLVTAKGMARLAQMLESKPKREAIAARVAIATIAEVLR